MLEQQQLQQCKKCTRGIVYCKHERTKRDAPIDAVPTAGGTALIDWGAMTYRIIPDSDLDKYPGQLHKLHWVTCPFARDFRKPPSEPLMPKQSAQPLLFDLPAPDPAYQPQEEPAEIPTLMVMLAVNDNNGNFTGLVEQVDIADIIRIDCGFSPAKIRYNLSLSSIVIEGEVYGVTGYRTWVGNMAWDGVRMPVASAANLLEQLRVLGWMCEEAEERMYDAWDKNDKLKHILKKLCREEAARK